MSAILPAVVAALVALLFGAVPGTAVAATPATAPVSVTAVSAGVPGSESGLPVVTLSSLPAQATDTYELIEEGGPYPYDQDGTVFQNREGILPAESSGYYHEYTVVTPGSSDRGARRIITGSADEFYYTSDHYESFVVVDETYRVTSTTTNDS